jgi:quercetin 2,3-dioxygenase
MINIRKSADRGHVKFDWLDTQHTFSFGHYHDPNHMGFGPLRVINEDVVRAGAGFPKHPHDNMEIVTYILEGALEHKDSMGNGGVIRPGDIQRMSAGTGVTHSEFNHSPSDPVHLLQIWFLPGEKNIKPGYEQKSFSTSDKKGKLKLIASHGAREDSVDINQDVDIYSALLSANDNVVHEMREGRLGWVQVAKGSVEINGQKLEAGDGAAITDEKQIRLSGADNAEIVFFDMVK